MSQIAQRSVSYFIIHSINNSFDYLAWWTNVYTCQLWSSHYWSSRWVE